MLAPQLHQRLLNEATLLGTEAILHHMPAEYSPALEQAIRQGVRQALPIAAEGVTAGGVAERLGRVPGASAWFRGGLVAYDNRVKTEMLAVPQALLDEQGAVSAAVAEAMAVGCRVRFGTDLAVSTVGIAGPGGGRRRGDDTRRGALRR